MSKYARIDNDLYPSPPWVVHPLIGCMGEPRGRIWEPAAGPQRMLVKELRRSGYDVDASDITDRRPVNFIEARKAPKDVRTIITNPPYKKELLPLFILTANRLMKPKRGLVAMLLRLEYDAGNTKRYMFAECPAFRMKITLHTRLLIPGFVHVNGPTKHHAWYVWDHSHDWDIKEQKYA